MAKKRDMSTREGRLNAWLESVQRHAPSQAPKFMYIGQDGLHMGDDPDALKAASEAAQKNKSEED